MTNMELLRRASTLLDLRRQLVGIDGKLCEIGMYGPLTEVQFIRDRVETELDLLEIEY